jgi:exodeoxyribonuclease-3
LLWAIGGAMALKPTQNLSRGRACSPLPPWWDSGMIAVTSRWDRIAVRIVTWNCNRAFHKKYEHILVLKPDIAVIQECADVHILRRAAPQFAPTSAIWIGDNDQKGLGVFTFGPFRAELSTIYRDNCPYIIPVLIDGPIRFNVLAVWACHNKQKSFEARLGPLRRSLDLYRNFIEGCATVVTGDFNDNVQWDKPRRLNNHGTNVGELQTLGLVSAYHHYRNEEQGAELLPTIYWRDRKIDGPRYHIDYCFIPADWTKTISSLTVGRFEDWVANGLSDHVPMVADLALQRTPTKEDHARID